MQADYWKKNNEIITIQDCLEMIPVRFSDPY